MRKAKSIFQGKNEPVWITGRPTGMGHRSQKLSRAQLLRFGRGDHQRHPARATAPRQVAGLSSVVAFLVL